VDVLWSPWRYDYITGSGAAKTGGCAFCDLLESSASDEDKYILKRAEFNIVILNIFPYATGHLMILPYAHVADLAHSDKNTTDELMDLTVRTQAALTEIYRPDGFNIGMNIGKAAGAGVSGHYHMHILPRWVGDVNFMTAIGQTRTMPESLHSTFEKLKGKI